MSDLYSLAEYILQMAQSLTTGLQHDSTTNQTANSGHMHRIEPSKVVDVTKMALRQLAIGRFNIKSTVIIVVTAELKKY